jgi:macrolide-specific efflux system membrane fusion protein
VQYGTIVTLAAPPPNLRPGMSASIAVTVAQAPNVTFLPSVAVTPIGGQGASAGTVRVLGPDGVPQDRTVGLGLSSDAITEVRTGLAPGELVVLPDPNSVNVFEGDEPPPRIDNGGGGGTGGGR